jgi:hypothetical protein
MARYFELEAQQLLVQAKLPVTREDTAFLAADIRSLADADHDNAFAPESERAYRAAMALKHQIGGLSGVATHLLHT